MRISARPEALRGVLRGRALQSSNLMFQPGSVESRFFQRASSAKGGGFPENSRPYLVAGGHPPGNEILLLGLSNLPARRTEMDMDVGCPLPSRACLSFRRSESLVEVPCLPDIKGGPFTRFRLPGEYHVARDLSELHVDRVNPVPVSPSRFTGPSNIRLTYALAQSIPLSGFHIV